MLYYNLDAGIVSSSFYAICSVLGRLTLSQQSACEYVFNGVVSGNETLFREVALAPIGATIRVGPRGLEIVRPALRVTRAFTSETRAASLDRSMALLDRYFGAVAAQLWRSRRMRALGRLRFPPDSGAFCAGTALRPRVYVYGSAAEKDVRLAREIAAARGILARLSSTRTTDRSSRPRVCRDGASQLSRRGRLWIRRNLSERRRDRRGGAPRARQHDRLQRRRRRNLSQFLLPSRSRLHHS